MNQTWKVTLRLCVGVGLGDEVPVGLGLGRGLGLSEGPGLPLGAGPMVTGPLPWQAETSRATPTMSRLKRFMLDLLEMRMSVIALQIRAGRKRPRHAQVTLPLRAAGA